MGMQRWTIGNLHLGLGRHHSIPDVAVTHLSCEKFIPHTEERMPPTTKGETSSTSFVNLPLQLGVNKFLPVVTRRHCTHIGNSQKQVWEGDHLKNQTVLKIRRRRNYSARASRRGVPFRWPPITSRAGRGQRVDKGTTSIRLIGTPSGVIR